MAIIICPECGGKISDKATACVHCGCTVFACPECGIVYTEKNEICPECGYRIEKEKAKNDTPKASVEGLSEIMARWKSQSTMYTVSRGLFNWILAIAAVVMLVLALGSIITWHGGDMVTNFADTKSNMKLFFVLACVFSVLLSAHNNVIPILSQLDLLKWNNTNHIDLKKTLHEAYSMDFQKNTVEGNVEVGFLLDTYSWAACYEDDYLARGKHKNQGIVRVILFAIVSVAVTIFLINNAQVYMEAELWASDALDIEGFTFSMIESWWLLIVAAVAWIAVKVYEKKTEKQQQAVRDEWIEKNMPEHLEKHKKYVKNIIDYVVDSTSK